MSSTNRVAAYGAGWATGNFEPLVYFRKPEVILRLVAWVRSVTVSIRNGSGPSALGVCRVTSWRRDRSVMHVGGWYSKYGNRNRKGKRTSKNVKVTG